ncbi:MAG: superoxide dismutase family protein, partial [Chloroflexota bacterium]|nr:superoxide dismutase family protein [Chloroflexota bacterium]
GMTDPVGGMSWYDGNFYITHRDAADRTGAVSRVSPAGEITQLFSGFLDSQSEHPLSDIQPGPDGRLYIGTGPAANSAVVGIDIAAFVERSPELHTTPCQDITLTGQNFQTPDFRTEDSSDLALTGAYVPFGTETTPGQVIPGTVKCGGAVIAFDPASVDPEGTLDVYAWGMRNVIGVAWDADGVMYAGVNGFDVRGSRPVNDEYDATYRVEEGEWYGWPDYSAALEPLIDPKFDSPDSLQAPFFIGDGAQPKGLAPVIDHEASGLAVADPSLVYGLHGFNSSPSKLAVAPESWGEFAGQVFVAEWGDLSPNTNPLRDQPEGYQVVRINPETGLAEPFVYNIAAGPASRQEARLAGIERPIDVKFGPDGAMYIVDYGIANVNPARASEGQVPYEFPPETGAVWRVFQTDGDAAVATGDAPLVVSSPTAGEMTPQADTEMVADAATPMGASEDMPMASIDVMLFDMGGEEVGTATFTEGDDGEVAVTVMAEGIPSGEHGIHVHGVGVCDPSSPEPFTTAGGHFNPTGTQHGDPDDPNAHAGDLGNITPGEELTRTTDRFIVSAGPNSLRDIDGSALLIHAQADDLTTDPAGNSGGRIACGVIASPMGTPAAGTPTA